MEKWKVNEIKKWTTTVLYVEVSTVAVSMEGVQGVSVEGGGGELVPTLFIGQAKACVAEKKINF